MQNQWGNYGSPSLCWAAGPAATAARSLCGSADSSAPEFCPGVHFVCWYTVSSKLMVWLWLQTQQYSYASGSQQPQQQVPLTFALAPRLVAELLHQTKRPGTGLNLLVCAHSADWCIRRLSAEPAGCEPAFSNPADWLWHKFRRLWIHHTRLRSSAGICCLLS